MHLPKVLCNFFKKNNEIHNYNTRTKDMYRISHESQIFSSVGAKIWDALSIKIDVIVSLIKGDCYLFKFAFFMFYYIHWVKV